MEASTVESPISTKQLAVACRVTACVVTAVERNDPAPIATD